MRIVMFRRGLLPLVLSLFPTVLFGADAGIASGTVNHASVKRYPTVVYIEEITGQKFNPPATSKAVDQKGKVFLPHVLPVVAGTRVDFLNSDSFKHSVYSPDGEKYDLGEWDKGGKGSYTFKQPGVYTQLCHVHPEMIGYVVVVKTPYFVVADAEGKFRIPNIPAGTWKLKVWNERLRPVQLGKSFDIKVAAGQEAKVDLTF